MRCALKKNAVKMRATLTFGLPFGATSYTIFYRLYCEISRLAERFGTANDEVIIASLCGFDERSWADWQGAVLGFVTEGECNVSEGRIPRTFWSYTAGKGSVDVEERYAKWEAQIQFLKENLPGMLGLAFVLLLTLVMLIMMFAEFRGFYIIEQFWDLFRVN